MRVCQPDRGKMWPIRDIRPDLATWQRMQGILLLVHHLPRLCNSSLLVCRTAKASRYLPCSCAISSLVLRFSASGSTGSRCRCCCLLVGWAATSLANPTSSGDALASWVPAVLDGAEPSAGTACQPVWLPALLSAATGCTWGRCPPSCPAGIWCEPIVRPSRLCTRSSSAANCMHTQSPRYSHGLLDVCGLSLWQSACTLTTAGGDEENRLNGPVAPQLQLSAALGQLTLHQR